jgi:hypothetical protein
MPADAFRRFVAEDVSRWSEAVKNTGIKAN